MPIWCRLLLQAALRPAAFARDNAGKSMAARTAMIAMTTNSSISVKATDFRIPWVMPGKLPTRSAFCKVRYSLVIGVRQFLFKLHDLVDLRQKPAVNFC